MKTRLIGVMALMASVLAGTGGVCPPVGAEGASEKALAAVAAAEGPIEPVAPTTRATSDGASADLGNGSVSVSTDPTEGIAVEGPEGVEVSLAIGSSSDGAPKSGNVVFDGVDQSTSIVARPTAGGAQALLVIADADAPTEFAFPVEADGASVRLRPSADGGVEILDARHSKPIAVVAPPWATDANGNAVPTHFEVRGSSLVQTVQHRGAAYPVVADPKYTWGYVTGTTYYNRKETRSLKTRSYAYVVAAGICAALGPQSAARHASLPAPLLRNGTTWRATPTAMANA